MTIDPNAKLSIWEQLFTPIMNHFFPVTRNRIRKNTHPGINHDMLSLMRVRDQARRRAWKTKSADDFSAYKRLRNRVTSNLRKAKLEYFQRQLDGCKGETKSFWKLIKNVLPSNNKSTKIEILVVDGVDIKDSKGICDLLNSYFTSIAKDLDLLSARNTTPALPDSNPQYEIVSTSTLQSPSPNSVLHFSPTTDDKIFRMLANLKPNKAIGRNNIPAKILKIAAGHISQSLSCIINSSLAWRLGYSRIDGKLQKYHALQREVTETITDPFPFCPVCPRYANLLLTTN